MNPPCFLRGARGDQSLFLANMQTSQTPSELYKLLKARTHKDGFTDLMAQIYLLLLPYNKPRYRIKTKTTAQEPKATLIATKIFKIGIIPPLNRSPICP